MSMESMVSCSPSSLVTLTLGNTSAARLALERLMTGRTSVTIAHRMSTAESADEVVVVDRGRIVQRGPHAELVCDPDGVYAGLHRSWVAQQGR